MAFFAPSRLRDFFSTTCAWPVTPRASIAAINVPVWIFIKVLELLPAGRRLLGAASRCFMLFDRVIEGGFAEVRLGKRAPNLDLRYVRDVLREHDGFFDFFPFRHQSIQEIC